jgi:hypothetical protein
MPSLKSPEDSVFLAFKEIIKKQRGYFKAIVRQLIYSSSSFFLLLACIFTIVAISSAWLKTKGFNYGNGSFRVTFPNASSGSAITPFPFSKKKGSVARYILDPETLKSNNSFQRLNNCLDGICADSNARCALGSCRCNGICISNSNGNAVTICQNSAGLFEATSCALQLADTSPIPPPFSSAFNFTYNLTVNNIPQTLYPLKLWGCSRNGNANNCNTISLYDRSVSLITDQNEWYFINFPRGLA